MYLASLIFLHNQKPLLAVVAAGLALTHYYGIVYLATLLPAVMLQCGRRRFLYGVAVGFLPTAPKWVTLALTIRKSGAAAVGTAEPPPGLYRTGSTTPTLPTYGGAMPPSTHT